MTTFAEADHSRKTKEKGMRPWYMASIDCVQLLYSVCPRVHCRPTVVAVQILITVSYGLVRALLDDGHRILPR